MNGRGSHLGGNVTYEGHLNKSLTWGLLLMPKVIVHRCKAKEQKKKGASLIPNENYKGCTSEEYDNRKTKYYHHPTNDYERDSRQRNHLKEGYQYSKSWATEEEKLYDP